MNAELVCRLTQRIREHSPIVHNITNQVVTNISANVLLAVGASPIMSHAVEEIDDLAALAGALVINIGTLDKSLVKVMHQALAAALSQGLPIVVDPVGAGATRYRTDTALSLLAAAAPGGKLVIRGNSSEIVALSGGKGRTKGVDSTMESGDALEDAQKLALEHHAVVTVSGAVDMVTDGAHVFTIAGGSPWMSKVTGMGCSASALTGAFCAVAQYDATESRRRPPLGCWGTTNMLGAVGAMAVMSGVGSAAALRSVGPGTFIAQFLDILHCQDEVEPALREHVVIADRTYPPERGE